MHTIRNASVADAALIAQQRCLMFRANNLTPVTTWDELELHSVRWLSNHLADGSYAGWIIEEDGAAMGGAGVWFMEWPPHFIHLEPVRGYLLNFYVEPQARGRGLAKQLVGLAVAECAKRGVKVAVLHASPMGRPVYEALDWQSNNEMILHISNAETS